MEASRELQSVDSIGTELEQIEKTLRGCRCVADAAVTWLPRGSAVAPTLVAFVKVRQGVRALLPRHIRAMVAQRLPRHLVPSRVQIVDELPLLPDSQIDRVRLSEMESGPIDGAQRPHAWTPDVVRIIEETLGVTGVSPEDDLPTLAGDPTRAAELASKLEQRFSIQLPLGVLQSAESVAQLIQWMTFKGPVEKTRLKFLAAVKQQVAEKPSYTAKLAQRGGHALIRWVARNEFTRRRMRRDASRWTVGIHNLMRIGELSAASDEVARFNLAHPGLPVASNLNDILKLLPPINPSREPFQDDPMQDLQVNRGHEGDAVIFLFCGFLEGLGVPLPVVHRWLSHLPATLVYIRDFRRKIYFAGLPRFGDGSAATIAGLAKLAHELQASRIMCWGNSAGGAASLKYGIELGAERVVACEGSYDFGRQFNAHLNTALNAARLRETYPESELDIRKRYLTADRAPQSLISYGEASWDDRLHAEHMEGVQGVHLLRVENQSSHNSLVSFIRRGWMDPVLAWLMSGEPLPHVIPDGTAPQMLREPPRVAHGG